MSPVPGMPVARPEAASVRYSASVSDVDVHADVGSPTLPVEVDVYIDAGVVISSSGPSTPALDFSGFNPDSTILVFNEGVVQGAGGEGGAGALAYQNGNGSGAGTWANGYGGGGGGGNGNAGGVAGTATSPGNDGTTGAVHPSTTPQSGGAALTNATSRSEGFSQDGTAGGVGGDAMSLGDVSIILTNDGSIWGGGGGGGGGGAEAAPEGGSLTVPGNFDPEASAGAGGNGGGPGLAGSDGETPTAVRLFQRERGLPGSGGAAGYAIRHSASGGVTFVSGSSSPAVEGTVGT